MKLTDKAKHIALKVAHNLRQDAECLDGRHDRSKREELNALANILECLQREDIENLSYWLERLNDHP